VCRWYAWSHLVSPAQHALNLQFYQLPVLKSFVRNPQVHVCATADPEMLTGPFIHLGPAAAGEMHALIKDIQEHCAHLLEFADAWRAFDRRLQETADGTTLDELYNELPTPLSGLVELVYDLSSRPTMRLIEELLRADCLDNSPTQELSLYDGLDADRSFFLNTPRPVSPARVDLRVPFADPRIDLLASMRIRPAPLSTLSAAFGLTEDTEARLRKLVSHEPPRRRTPQVTEEGVRLRHFGHACVLVQTAKTSVLFDPLPAWDANQPGGSLTFDDLPDHIDYIYITHNHQDHFCPETLLQLRHRVGKVLIPRSNPSNIADPSMRLILERMGFRSVETHPPLTTIPLPSGSLTTIPFLGEHAGFDVLSKQGALLTLQGRRLLFLADSDCSDCNVYRRIAPLLGEIDVLFIGMECYGAPLSWLYGPYLSGQVTRKMDESRRLSGANCERAWRVIQEVKCKRLFVYAMGQERWLQYLLGLAYEPGAIQLVESDRLIERCRAHGIPAQRLTGCTEMWV